jgi:hypothetical protein
MATVLVYWWTGFFSVEEVASPNIQYQEVGFPEEVSLNWTVRGDIPEVTFDVKFAMGSGKAGAGSR